MGVGGGERLSKLQQTRRRGETQCKIQAGGHSSVGLNLISGAEMGSFRRGIGSPNGKTLNVK